MLTMTAADYLASSLALADLSALNARFIENFVTNDVAAHDALLHPLFSAIQSDGRQIDRASYLRRWATGFDPDVIVYWDLRDERIAIFGNIALVRATNKHVMRRAGGKAGDETAGMTIYTDIYLYERGAWSCIQAQSTTVAPGQEPGDDTILSVYIKGVRQ